VNADVKVACPVAGMIAGADSIDHMGLLRHGAMPALFGGIRAWSALGSFLRSFTWGDVLQLQKVHRLVPAELARRAGCCPARTCSRSWTSTRSKSGSASGPAGITGPASQRRRRASRGIPPAGVADRG
jgi:hypothetical protein